MKRIKLIDRQYLLNCGFEPFQDNQKDRLKKKYPFVSIYNDDSALLGIISVEVVIQKYLNQWLIESCYKEGETENIWNLIFRDKSMKSLLLFDVQNSIE